MLFDQTGWSFVCGLSNATQFYFDVSGVDYNPTVDDTGRGTKHTYIYHYDHTGSMKIYIDGDLKSTTSCEANGVIGRSTDLLPNTSTVTSGVKVYTVRIYSRNPTAGELTFANWDHP